MKKILMTILIGVMLCMGVLGGCGNSAGEASDKNASKSEKELTGKIDEIKDFQFVITDDKDTPYSFTFDEKPNGLDSVSNGDTVIVKYTGTISEVDPFDGEVISVEKVK